MKERPILMSAPMVRATLDGTKMQTRRLSGLDDVNEEPGKWELASCVSGDGRTEAVFYPGDRVPSLSGDAYCRRCKCPYPLGTRLWVRESFHAFSLLAAREPKHPLDCLSYRADCDTWPEDWKWHPSIFMPRWASRITLEVTEVRVQRLNSISGNDCYAEGIERPSMPNLGSVVTMQDNARYRYRTLWESINGSGSWALNPWVWSITFKRISP